MIRPIVLIAWMILPAPLMAETVRSIEVSGNVTVEAESIRAHIKSKNYTPAVGDAAIKSLFATGMFSDVSIDQRGSTLLIKVVENPIIKTIEFVGNKNNDKSKLDPLLDLKLRARFTKAKAHADSLKIRELYRSQGRMATTVDPKANIQANGQVALVFEIMEGAISRIDQIAFIGNHAMSESQLRDVVSTSVSAGWLDILKTAAFYDPARIEHDRELLRIHYLKNGFPDVKITDAKAVENAKRDGYSIVFTVDEGSRYFFGKSVVETKIPNVDVASLQPMILVREGNVFNSQVVDKSVERISLALGDQKQTSAHIKLSQKRDDINHVVNMHFIIEERPPLYVERIEISGNKQTNDAVIRRELRFVEGDLVNPYVLERGRKRVQALGFFKSVTLKRTQGSQDEYVVVKLEVVEDDTRNLGFGVGYSATQGVVGDVSYTERNLFGNGQSLRIKLAGSASLSCSSGLPCTQAEVGFTEPHLMGTNVISGFDLFYRDLNYTNYASFSSLKVGGDVRLGYQISDEWSATANYTFSRNTLYNVGALASTAIKEAAGPTGTNTYYSSSIGYTVAYDTRDNKKRPTEGVYFSLSQDLAGLGGDVQYIRSSGDARAYYTLTDNVIGMSRTQAGMITPWGGQDVRLLDMFYRGNDLVRGFAPAGIGPRDLGSVNQDALGGSMFIGTSAEVLFALPGGLSELGLRGAVFADVGSVWGTNKTAAGLPALSGSAFAPRASVGTGVAWDSPLGALRVDYGIPVVKQSSDKVQPFSFGLSPL
jgi:outer membrane protein insertion porin family